MIDVVTNSAQTTPTRCICLSLYIIIAERLSARHIIRHYDVIHLCMYVSHALECNFLRLTGSFSDHI